MHPLTSAALLASTLAVASCGFEPLEPVAAPDAAAPDDLAGAAVVEGINVLPAVIHPGDRVWLHDPVEPLPGRAAAIYLWSACDGTIDGATYGPDVTWVAPAVPGVYAVTVNIANAERDRPSRVLQLCVAAPGEDDCGSPPVGGPAIEALAAAPDAFVQANDCPGSCTTTLSVTAAPSTDAPASIQWTTRGGDVVGAGATVGWSLPAVGCCTESYVAAVTLCGAEPGTATTGYVDVVVVPG